MAVRLLRNAAILAAASGRAARTVSHWLVIAGAALALVSLVLLVSMLAVVLNLS